jgi:DNA-binding IclR family transcriptional regulator
MRQNLTWLIGMQGRRLEEKGGGTTLGSSVQSVERAILILKSFSLETPERSVGELSFELGLHKSTVSRLIRTLERGGLLSRDPDTKRYRLGLDLIGLASQVTSHMDVRDRARPALRQLAHDCQETVNLVVLDAGQVINLEQFVPPERQVKNIGRVGRRLWPHCTAAGKVLLAHLPPIELDQVLLGELVRFTPHTITSPPAVREELVRVREQGFAVAREELEEGLNALASPIYDHSGQVVAAASVSGPAYRLTPERLPLLAGRLVEVTRQISAWLGYLQPTVKSKDNEEKVP